MAARWEALPAFVQRDILRTYVPQGFSLTKDRKLRAEVCGVLLEAAIPTNERTRPGLWYGGRTKENGRPVLDRPAVHSSLTLCGGKVGEAGYEPSKGSPWVHPLLMISRLDKAGICANPAHLAVDMS